MFAQTTQAPAPVKQSPIDTAQTDADFKRISLRNERIGLFLSAMTAIATVYAIMWKKGR